MSKQLTAQAPVDPIVLGKMGSSYGIRGWLRVFSSTEDAESIFDKASDALNEGQFRYELKELANMKALIDKKGD